MQYAIKDSKDRRGVRLHCLSMLLVLLLVSCGKTVEEDTGEAKEGNSATPTWEEPYDMGIRLLNEGNYQEAMIAFTVAIENNFHAAKKIIDIME